MEVTQIRTIWRERNLYLQMPQMFVEKTDAIGVSELDIF